MKQRILSSLRLIKNTSWIDEFIAFVELSETMLLSEHPGQYTAGDLLAELKIRIKSLHDSGIGHTGIMELQKKLTVLGEDQIVKNYILKCSEQVGIVYFDERLEVIIGAILIRQRDSL